MSKHHRTAGTDYKVITIGGKEYTLRPLAIGVYAEMESYIISQKPDPLEIASEAVAKLPSSRHEAIWKAAMSQAVNARTVTSEEMAAFEDTVNGLAWKIWQCVRQDHPEINSVKAARALLMQAGEEHRFEELSRVAEIASGESDLKKSSGQAEAIEKADPAGQSSTVS